MNELNEVSEKYYQGYREGEAAGYKIFRDHPEIAEGIVPPSLWPKNPWVGKDEEAERGWQVGFFDAID